MKTSLHPFRTFWSIFAVAFVGLLSCEENEPIGPDQLLVTIKANYSGACNGYTKIVITDSQNQILAVKEVDGQVDTPVIAPASTSEENINLFIVVYFEDIYRVSGFRGLKKGSEFMGYIPQVHRPWLDIEVNTANTPAYDNFTLSAAGGGMTYPSRLTTPNSIRLSTTTNQLFVQLVSEGKGRSGFVDVPDTSGEILLDYSQLNGVSEKREIDIGQNVTDGYLSMNGAISESDSFTESYTLYAGAVALGTYVPSEFARYFTTVNYQIGERQYTETRSEIWPSLRYEPMKLDVNMKSANPENVDLTVTGEYDYYEMCYANGMNVELHIFGRQGDTMFTMPDFSKIKGLKSFPYHAFKAYGLKLYNLKSLEEDQTYFKYFSAVPDIRSAYDQQVLTLNGPL